MQIQLNKFVKNHVTIILLVLIASILPILINNYNLNKDNIDPNFLMEDQTEFVHSATNVNDFKYYKEIIIDHTKVGTGTHLNFPLLIDITDQDLHDDVQVDGDDIAFYNGTDWLDYEIELFDQDYSGTEAHLVAWVRLSSLSSSADTTIYMYYGNSTMLPQQRSSDVWSSNYKAVWHLNTTSPQNSTLLDSTSNNNDGTNYGADDVSPLIGHSRDYDGENNYSDMGSGTNIANIFNGGGTVSAWIYPNDAGEGYYGRVLDKSSDLSASDGWCICLDGYDAYWYDQLLFIRDFSVKRGLWMSGTGTITYNQWNHIVITYDDTLTSNDPKLYINGVDESGEPDWEDETPLGSATTDLLQDLYIAQNKPENRAFNGTIDEVRMYSGIKTPGWIQTEYNNQYNPNSFYSIGSEVVIDNTPPEITINTPTNDNLFGSVAPDFNVKINDSSSISSRWYRLTNGTVTTVNTTFTQNGTISPTRWGEIGNGSVTIQFFANDSSGNIGFSEVTIRKDINSPIITINSPTHYELLGSSAPDYNVEISDINGLNYTWYTLNNSIETYFTTNGTISPSIWSTCGNGTVSIKFYANDSIGNQGFSEVIVRKEISAPTINVNSPSYYDLFSTIAPDFNVEIWDNNNVEDMWYTLNNGIETYFFTNGTINQTRWDDMENGTVSIKFYANNSLGNGGFSEVIVRKDIIGPVITINNPDDYDLYGHLPIPMYDVSINEPNGIESKWYTLDEGTTNTTFSSLTGVINQTRWDEVGNGTVTIRFYANDSIGNVGFSEVFIYKDILGPMIIINSPNPYEVFGSTAPNFDIQTIDSSGISLRWYNLENGDNITCGTTGQISPFQWGYQENGTVSIKFYAMDSMGNENFSEVIVRKDIDPPSIIINNPILDQIFGETPPIFNVEITDTNGIDTMWYSLDGGDTNTIFTTNESINSAIWDAFGDGNINIRFYANNSIGSSGYSEVSVIKDIYSPSITINTPNNYTYWNHAPILNISSYDISFDNLWIMFGSSNVSITSDVNFQLNSSIWNSLSQGLFQIFIYANDTFGHLNTKILNLYKDTIGPSAPTLDKFPIGEVTLPITFDWEDGSDPSGISYYRLIIDNEQDPYNTPGFIYDINITNTGFTSSYYELEEFLPPGSYYFFLYQIDGAGNQGDFTTDTFTIKQQTGLPSGFPWWLIIIIIIPFGVVIAVISIRKSKKKEIQVVLVDKQVEALKEQKKQLELTAKAALKSGNYMKAAQYYQQCKEISNQLLEEGYEEEKDKVISYERIEIGLKNKMAAVPLTYNCMNIILTTYFSQIGIKYYSDPDIYPETQKSINGLILNDSKFLQNRLTDINNGQDLIDELQINPDTIEHINAIQFFFTNDLSEEELINACRTYQNPQMVLFIVGIPWPILEYDEVMKIPMDKSIRFRDNIRIINIDLFIRLIGMDGQYKDNLLEIIELDFNYEKLQKIFEKISINLYGTEELKQDLKQKEWFFLI